MLAVLPKQPKFAGFVNSYFPNVNLVLSSPAEAGSPLKPELDGHRRRREIKRRNRTLSQPVAFALLIIGGFVASASLAVAQSGNQFVEPIFRVDHEVAAGQPTQVASRIAVAKPQPPFDLSQLPGEHPLMPALRVAKQSLQTIDTRIRDYNAIMMKQERIDGELMPKEVAFIKVRHQPFGVYMYFLGESKGRECLYNDMPDGTKGKLIARDCGFKKRLGKFTLDPEGAIAMKGQKYPIMKLGLRELTNELVTVASNDVQFGECEVRHGQGTMEGRSITWLEVVHPRAATELPLLQGASLHRQRAASASPLQRLHLAQDPWRAARIGRVVHLPKTQRQQRLHRPGFRPQQSRVLQVAKTKHAFKKQTSPGRKPRVFCAL